MAQVLGNLQRREWVDNGVTWFSHSCYWNCFVCLERRNRFVVMKVGDTVVHKEDKYLGRGRIVSFKAFHGTVLVKWDSIKECRYHIPWALRKEDK